MCVAASSLVSVCLSVFSICLPTYCIHLSMVCLIYRLSYLPNPPPTSIHLSSCLPSVYPSIYLSAAAKSLQSCPTLCVCLPINTYLPVYPASRVAQLVKNLPGFLYRCGVIPWAGKIPWRREKLPTPVFWPGELHGLYSPWGRKDRTQLSGFYFASPMYHTCLSS